MRLMRVFAVRWVRNEQGRLPVPVGRVRALTPLIPWELVASQLWMAMNTFLEFGKTAPFLGMLPYGRRKRLANMACATRTNRPCCRRTVGGQQDVLYCGILKTWSTYPSSVVTQCFSSG